MTSQKNDFFEVFLLYNITYKIESVFWILVGGSITFQYKIRAFCSLEPKNAPKSISPAGFHPL